MTTTPAEIAAIQADALHTSQLADALLAGSVTAAQQSALEAAACSVYQGVYDLTPDPVSPTMPAPPGFTHLVLEDTFANLNNWNTFYGPGVRWDNFGKLPSPYSGGNMPGNDVALYNPSQCVLVNGVELRAVPYSGSYAWQGYSWLSGCLTSKKPMPSGEWFVQVKAKRPTTIAGMWPADWFLPNNSSQELDGYEGGWPGANPNQQGHSDTFASSGQVQNVWQTGVDMSAGFHVYGYHFKPGASFTVFFDGKQVYQYNGNLSEQAYYLFLQLQVAAPSTKGWHTVGGTTPDTMTVQEVQVWTP